MNMAIYALVTSKEIVNDRRTIESTRRVLRKKRRRRKFKAFFNKVKILIKKLVKQVIGVSLK